MRYYFPTLFPTGEDTVYPLILYHVTTPVLNRAKSFMNPFIFHIAAIPEIFLYFNLIQTADLEIFPYIVGVHEFENS